MTTFAVIHPGPLGPLTLVVSRGTATGATPGAAGEALVAALFDAPDPTMLPGGGAVSQATPLLDEARRQLDAWFAGQRRDFDLPLAPRGTPFQLEAWAALRRISWGETRSYAEQARALGRPEAVRAVGAANGRNPLAILIPCHRVIGAGGALVGYAGGLARKRWLLAHEQGALPLFAAVTRR